MPAHYIKSAILILTTIAAAIGLVTLLAWVALRPINHKNGFTRKFVAADLTLIYASKKNESVIGICGATLHHLYFMTRDPAILWVTDLKLQKGEYIILNVPNNKKIASFFCTVVDSPIVHIMAGNVPIIIKADLNSGASSTCRFPTALFTRSVKISPNTYVFRGFDTTDTKEGQIFIKGNPQTGELLRKNSIAFRDNDFAGITADGYLNHDEQTNMLTYVPFYRNGFFCLDTNLNLIYSGRTIDTVTTVQVKVGQVGKTVTNTSPARVINSKSRVAEGKLYIISKLQAENENERKFQSNATVDVYDIKNGLYEGSFYIPFYKEEKIGDFKVIGNIIVIMYKNYIALYQLPSVIGT